jgi:hypothetical protein
MSSEEVLFVANRRFNALDQIYAVIVGRESDLDGLCMFRCHRRPRQDRVDRDLQARIGQVEVWVAQCGP